MMMQQETKFTFRPKINVSKQEVYMQVEEQLERQNSSTPILAPDTERPLFQRNRTNTSRTLNQKQKNEGLTVVF